MAISFQDLLGDGKQALDQPLKPLWKCLLTEFIGTVVLIFVGCGCGLTLTADPKEERALAGVALCWAFTIAALGQTLGTYSGDLNPSITLAMVTTGKLPIMRAPFMIIVQCAGCTCGAYLLKLLLPDDIVGDFSITKIPESIGAVRGLFIEIIITTWLLLTICAACDEERKDLRGSTVLSIGFCIGGIILFAAPFTGASMNPARSLGPAIVANKFENHWVFWVGPIIGAQIGAHAYHHIFRVKWPVEKPVTV